VAAGLHVDPAEGSAVDGVDLGRDVGGGGSADGIEDRLGEGELEEIGVVLVVLAEGGVVGLEPEDAADIGDTDQEGAAFSAVEERSDRLQHGGLDRL